MAGVSLLTDTGPLVAFFNRADQYHSWVATEFDTIFQPLLTCEAVISETIFLLQTDGLSTDPLFQAIQRGKIIVQFSAANHWPDLSRLITKYADLPMSLADACLVRMTELEPHSQVLTTDRHFRLYRRSGRQLIALRAPFD